jgi:hypothetical protein
VLDGLVQCRAALLAEHLPDELAENPHVVAQVLDRLGTAGVHRRY